MKFLLACLLGFSYGSLAYAESIPLSRDAAAIAAEVDRLILKDLEQQGRTPAAMISDEEFLRRATLDLTGQIPSPSELTRFGLETSPRQRTQLVDQLLESREYGTNWSAYWRDVIFMRATEQRASFFQGVFQAWMRDQLQANKPWDEITRELLTATGDVRENGATGFMFAHNGDPQELAGETSRIFLGIQIQCANCHDHPTDTWTRAQFHEMAAYFPRVQVNQRLQQQPPVFEVVSNDRQTRSPRDFLANRQFFFRMVDRNRDGKITRQEAGQSERFNRIFERVLPLADSDKDEALTVAEFKNIPLPPDNRRGSTEYYMSNLEDPTAAGTLMQPVFFVNENSAGTGLTDQQRRHRLADEITSKDNEWFAKAYVSRIWSELIGHGFYQPLDDIGPLREARHEDALTCLSEAFIANNYDTKWLFRTILSTQVYQRALNSTPVDNNDPSTFACAIPKRLRAEQIYDALLTLSGRSQESNAIGVGRAYALNNPERKFAELFGYDPSTPQLEVLGDIPQSLFMMNSGAVQQLTSARGNTPLARLLRQYDSDEDVLRELYVLVLSREPSTAEVQICKEYFYEINQRTEAFEDLMWALVNSSEFITRR